MTALAIALALLGATGSGAQGEPAERCRIRQDPPATRLIAAAHYEAETHSTVWVGDPDEMTGVIDVRLDRGGPVHLVLMTFRPVVYRFSGQIGRVRRLTLISRKGSGAVGIPRHRVSFLPRCLSYTGEADGFARAVAALFGRTPDAVTTAYGLWRLRVGHGIDGLEREDRPGWSYVPGPEAQRLMRYAPGGIARIDPLALVTDAPVGPYETLPQEAGLRQLLASGALVRATVADAQAWEAAARARGAKAARQPDIAHRRAYRAVRPIRIPAGLCGAHGVAFYAPSPRYLRGSPCHSTLFFDDGTDSLDYRHNPDAG